MGRASRAKRERREARAQKPAPKQTPAKLSKRKLALQLSLLAAAVGFAVAVMVMNRGDSGGTEPLSNQQSGADGQVATATGIGSGHPSASMTLQPRDEQYPVQPESLKALLNLDKNQLRKVSIGRANLLAATGLPGADNLTLDKRLATIDRWARRAKFETQRHLYRVNDPRYADEYHNSEAYFRAYMLKQVLMQDCGLKYNKDRAFDVEFSHSQDLFIHGLVPTIASETDTLNGGTCVSMPVLYAAVGRRLGYPIKLVFTEQHVFCRWDGQEHPNPGYRERFNIETTNLGMKWLDDEYYLDWPKDITMARAERRGYLQSLTPLQEIAQAFANRGHCLVDNGSPKGAWVAFSRAHNLDPERSSYRSWRRQAQRRLAGPSGRSPHRARWLARQRQRREQQRRNHMRQAGLPSQQWDRSETRPGQYGQPRQPRHQPGMPSNPGFQPSPRQPTSPNRRGNP
jgi:hypothetical protein